MMNRTAKQQICEACIGPVATGQTGEKMGIKTLERTRNSGHHDLFEAQNTIGAQREKFIVNVGNS